MPSLRAFWGKGTNVGDTLTPVILEHFTKYKAEWVSSTEQNKLLMCGSILEHARSGDIILGAGHYKKELIDLRGTNVLALRGMLSGEAPRYGDPAVLLPLIYKPFVGITKKLGNIPHLWDQKNYTDYIDVNLHWKDFVKEILKCEKIITTSLHGFIISQAFGVPVEWREYSEIPGAKIKYEDYLSGVENGIEKAQKQLLEALKLL